MTIAEVSNNSLGGKVLLTFDQLVKYVYTSSQFNDLLSGTLARPNYYSLYKLAWPQSQHRAIKPQRVPT